MNKDNKELIKQYQLIKEAFEPDTSPESGVVGPVKETFFSIKKLIDNAYSKSEGVDVVYPIPDDIVENIYKELLSAVSRAMSGEDVGDVVSLVQYYYTGSEEEDVQPADSVEHAAWIASQHIGINIDHKIRILKQQLNKKIDALFDINSTEIRMTLHSKILDMLKNQQFDRDID